MTAGDKQAVERIMALKDQAERAAREVAKKEAEADMAEKRVLEIDAELVAHGFDPRGDLMKQLADQSSEVEVEMQSIAESLVEVRAAAE